MFILYILFTILCCILTAYIVEIHIVSSLEKSDVQILELINKLGDYIAENKKQINGNIVTTNELVNRFNELQQTVKCKLL